MDNHKLGTCSDWFHGWRGRTGTWSVTRLLWRALLLPALSVALKKKSLCGEKRGTNGHNHSRCHTFVASAASPSNPHNVGDYTPRSAEFSFSCDLQVRAKVTYCVAICFRRPLWAFRISHARGRASLLWIGCSWCSFMIFVPLEHLFINCSLE